MKIDHNRQGHAILIEALSAYCDRHNEPFDVFITEDLDVSMSVNGRDLDMGDCLALMEQNFERAVNKAAQEFLEEKYGSILDRLNTLTDCIQEDCDRVIHDFNLSPGSPAF